MSLGLTCIYLPLQGKNENHDNSCNYEAEQVIQVNIAHFSAYKQKHQLTLRYNNHNKLT